MRKKEIIWICVLLILGGIYVRKFTTWFVKPQIGIRASLRPNPRPGQDAFMVLFNLSGDFKLTSLKVIPWQDNKFDPKAPPVWNLVSDSNSVPTRAFRYGQGIRGMKPALKGVHPDPLAPGMVYRLIVSAGNVTGFKDFETKNIGD